MAKPTVRVKIHRNHPAKFIGLMKEIIEKHEELGASSPLNSSGLIDMADFKAKVLQAEAFRNESIQHRAAAEARMSQARQILGTGNGQTSYHEGTLYFMLEVIKKFLLIKHSGSEEELSEYGFEVVLGTAKGIGRPKKKKS